jgi:hypothetical protein
MSVFGGLLIYATIISFTLFFQEQEDVSPIDSAYRRQYITD